MAPDEKLPLTESEIEGIEAAARAYAHALRTLLSVDLDSDPRRAELLVLEIICERRGLATMPQAEIERMRDIMRDEHGLLRAFARALDGDFVAQVAHQCATDAAALALAKPPRLTDIETRRAQLVDGLDFAKTCLKEFLLDTDFTDQSPEFNAVLRECAARLRECDPLCTCSDVVLEQAMRRAYESDNASARAAAKFTYDTDFFGDRRRYRCVRCFETERPCAQCKAHEPDPVSRLEARHGYAHRKVNAALHAPEN